MKNQSCSQCGSSPTFSKGLCRHCYSAQPSQKATQDAYRESHREQIRDRARAQYARSPEYRREYRRNHLSEAGERDWKGKLRREFGINEDDFNSMLSRQGGKCAICRGDNKYQREQRFSVDHDHETGKIRGLLCNHCNVMIGWAKESPEVLEAAADYLRLYSEPSS